VPKKQLGPKPVMGKRDQIFFWRKKKMLNDIEQWEKEHLEQEQREKEEQERQEKERQEEEKKEQQRLERQKKKEQKEKERAERRARGEEVVLSPADQLVFVCDSPECKEVIEGMSPCLLLPDVNIYLFSWKIGA